MKAHFPRSRARFWQCSVIGVAAIALGIIALQATGPAWWSQRGVTNSNSAADYAAANIGQLKQIASKAADELNARLPGGAGTAVNDLVTGWSQSPASGVTRNDYAVVNQGQLKAVAKPFYDRLIAIGHTSAYPWSSATTDDNSHAAANLGQVKSLFSFDLTATDAAHDANADGIPDWWAAYYGITNANAPALRGDGLTNLQAWQQGLNPNDFYDGHTPALTLASGNNQTGNPGGFVSAPLKVSVKDAAGNALASAPVTFAVTSGGGTLQKTNLTAAVGTLTVNADYAGQAKIYFKLPNTPNATCQITATAGSGSHTAQVAFTEHSGTGGGSPADPFDPNDIVATLNADGSVDVSWTNNTDPADTEPINIRYRDRDGNWVTAITVPAGTTSTHIPPP